MENGTVLETVKVNGETVGEITVWETGDRRDDYRFYMVANVQELDGDCLAIWREGVTGYEDADARAIADMAWMIQDARAAMVAGTWAEWQRAAGYEAL